MMCYIFCDYHRAKLGYSRFDEEAVHTPQFKMQGTPLMYQSITKNSKRLQADYKVDKLIYQAFGNVFIF